MPVTFLWPWGAALAISCALHGALAAVLALATGWASPPRLPAVLPVELVMAEPAPETEAPPPRVSRRQPRAPKLVEPRLVEQPKPIEPRAPEPPAMPEPRPLPEPPAVVEPRPAPGSPPSAQRPIEPPAAEPAPAPAPSPAPSTARIPTAPAPDAGRYSAPAPPQTGGAPGLLRSDAPGAIALPPGGPVAGPGPAREAGRADGKQVASAAVTQFARPQGGYQVRPTYPASARRLGIQGTSLLRVHVQADGRIGEIIVQQSAGHPDLDEAATDAVKRWRFEPARRGEQPVATWVLLPVEFRLR